MNDEEKKIIDDALELKERVKTSEKEFIIYMLILGALLFVVYFSYIAPKLKVGAGKESEPKYPISQRNPQDLGNAQSDILTFTLDAQDRVEWTYFDFSQASAVEVNDETKDPWDFKVQRLMLWFNQGKNRLPGTGLSKHQPPEVNDPAYGIKMMGAGDFNTYSNIKYDNFSRGISEVVEKWYHYNWVPTYLYPKDLVYGVHTTDQKFVLMKMKSYYCNGEAMGCISFSYVYQGDGSSSFKWAVK